MSASAPEPRLTPSWIDSYIEYTKDLPSPLLFRKWAAIGAVAAACERRVWAKVLGMDLYPNMYILLTAEPGIGKSVVINPIDRFWRKTGVLRTAPTTTTKAGLVDEMNEAKRTCSPGGGVSTFTFHSLQVSSSEFSALCPAYDVAFMATLTDLYDCRDEFSERTRGAKERLTIKSPQLNLLAGTQPDYMSMFLPEVAWGQGFMSRVIIVFTEERVRKDLFESTGFSPTIHEALQEDMNRIAKLHGQVIWAEGVRERINEWYIEGSNPRPQHPRLANYCTRRHVHLMKLAMIFSIARTNSLIIEMHDLDRAFETLFEAENSMPGVFRAMVAGGNATLIYDTCLYVKELQEKSGKAIPESEIVRFIHKRIPGREVKTIMDVMDSCGFIERDGADMRTGKYNWRVVKDPPPPMKQIPATPPLANNNKKEPEDAK